MRTLRSLGATISSTPLFLSFSPIRQRRLSAGRTSANAGSAASKRNAENSSARLARRRPSAPSHASLASESEGAPSAERRSASDWHAALTAQPSELHLRRPGHVFGD